jgi:hypothetical protein
VTRPTNERVARALLGSFAQDEVPAQAKERAFAAFGIAAAMASTSTVASGATAGVMGAAPGATVVAKSVLSAGALTVVKALIVGAAVGAVVTHTAMRVSTDSRDTRAGSPPAALQVATGANHLSDDAPVKTTDPTLAVAPTLGSADLQGRVEADAPLPIVARAAPASPPPVEASRARSPTRTRPASRLSSDDGAAPASVPENTSLPANAAPAVSVRSSSPATLTGEVFRLDRARAALREGSPSFAVRQLDAYDAEFANGALRQEATVLRIEVLVDMGDDVHARALAEAFAAAHPRSGYLNKIREMLARRSKRLLR